MRPLAFALALVLATTLIPSAFAQDDVDTLPDLDAAVERGVRILLDMQEGYDGAPMKAEWPYEGVYRVARKIPIGYRVGGTSIAATAIVRAPGYADDAERLAAVDRAVAFVCESIEHPLMAHAFESGYDVRGWGYTYGLAFLLELERKSLIPKGHEDRVAKTITFFIDGINATEMEGRGGWNYASRGARPSPFMTGPTLLALFAAKAQGHAVDDAIVERALVALERGRTPTGSWMYAGDTGARSKESVPGSVGRMLAGEVALAQAGRSTPDRIRSAVDAFLVHWEWLDKRRAQNGTHIAPYGIAPYYFYYAHHAAGLAIERLPNHERAEYRRRLNQRIFEVQLPSGGWNDRVFKRSENYGTAMILLTLTMKDEAAPAAWAPE